MESTYQVKQIETDFEIRQCWQVGALLRPHLTGDLWFSMVKEMMTNEKYRIAAILDEGKFVAFAGYRVMTTLHSGNFIYIDDLCTMESYRGKGLASQLLKYVKAVAIAGDKDAVVLDTDFINKTAQKVYLNNGFQLAALHLLCDLRT